ncbi:MAG TPA: FAD-linked oxidase C-terminal domain-containing protein [Solirubrobacteraceae bacterium]|nr:FAD-linked oxidase C-terminal domain-containing protein [Solirubrobacteraceae bacterium]
MRDELIRLIGAEQVLDAGDARWSRDAATGTGLSGRPDAVVAPRDAGEVAAVIAWCYERGVAIVPRGGGTGLSGGAVPVDGGVVLSLERLTRIRSFDPLLWRIEAEAGVTTATVQRLARENGLLFPIDPGAAEQSLIGGNVATNAGGPHAFKHGVMNRWVTGLEAVVAPGELIRVGGATRKDVAGYDLRGLLIGSEGTLGVVTSAWLRLTPAPPVSIPLAAFYADVAEGCEAIEQLLASGVVPAVVEYLDAGTLEIVAATFPGEVPPRPGFLVLTEADTSEHDAEQLAEALGATAQRPDPEALWRWRDGVSLTVGAHRGAKLAEDIAVPTDRLGEAIERTVEIGLRHGLEACSWGHAGDGNLHSTFLLSLDDPEQLRRAHAAAEELFALAIELGGTITGEHGIGVLKRGWLSRQWDPGAVRLHAAIKDALDPKGLFNPGKKLA